MTEQRKTAGEISKELHADKTKYDAREVGHAMVDDIEKHLYESAQKHVSIINEPEYCVVMVLAKDPLIDTVIRRKFYCWPYLPKPRPNQAVFLYNKAAARITKRLWILPSDVVMAELHDLSHVDARYASMKAWCDAFYKGWKFIRFKEVRRFRDADQKIHIVYLGIDGKETEESGRFVNEDPFYFWKYIRKEHHIDMPSEHEYFLQHRQELIEAGCKLPGPLDTEAFDFSKIHINDVIDTVKPIF